MAESVFRGTLEFLNELGVFDVVLPFLLVFTIMFALLEKTKIFGTDKIEDKEYSKKHLNSLAAFVVSFFVVASSQLVETITRISANVIVLVLAGMFFLMLAGSFQQQKPEGFFLEGRFKNLFMIIMFAGLVFIFLNAIRSGNSTWMEVIFGWLGQFSNNVSVSAIVLVLIVVGVMYYIGAIGGRTGSGANGESESK